MAISDFTELKAAIATWDDIDASLDAMMDDIILMANDTLNNGLDMGMAAIPALRVREMESVATLTPVAGVCALPDNYLQYRNVSYTGSPYRDLDYIAPNAVTQMYPDRAAGVPGNFTIIGSSLYVYPTTETDIDLHYYQKIPDLTEATPTNWLLSKRPMIYLHACLFQVGIIRRDDGLLQRSAQLVAALANGMRGSDEMANYAYAPVQVRGMTVA